MITAAHALIFSKDAEADRAFFRDVLQFSSYDVGGGWLIFNLPPTELAVHPADDNSRGHELYLICDNIQEFMEEMARREIACKPVEDAGWGLLTYITLPGGSLVGVYEVKHYRPEDP